MTAKRKRKLAERNARLSKLAQRQHSRRVASVTKLNIPREIDYIVRSAAERDARYVAIGGLVFFSTESGDAWMLDTEDSLALCLACDGEAQPVNIVDDEKTTAVEWDRTFAIEGDAFITTMKKSGRTTSILGYPTSAILAAIRSSSGAMQSEG